MLTFQKQFKNRYFLATFLLVWRMDTKMTEPNSSVRMNKEKWPLSVISDIWLLLCHLNYWHINAGFHNLLFKEAGYDLYVEKYCLIPSELTKFSFNWKGIWVLINVLITEMKKGQYWVPKLTYNFYNYCLCFR